MLRVEDIKKLIVVNQRSVQKLKEQQALLGINTPPHIPIEIEDKEAEIEKLQIELAVLVAREYSAETESKVEASVDHVVNKSRITNADVNILIVDDDSGWQGRLKRPLEASDYQVTTKSNFSEAKATLGEKEFDIIIVDMNLTEGGGEGWDLVESAENSNECKGIIIVSGAELSLIDVRDLFLNHKKVVDFIPKSPFDRERLKKTIIKTLSS